MRTGRPPVPAEERFMAYVHMEPMSGCWLWGPTLDKGGYGKFWNKDSFRAHRFSWEMHNGKIPDETMVCHTCDNRSCVNPRHLFLGDQESNMQDMVNKKRSMIGEKNNTAKLSVDDVKAVRARLALGHSQISIGRDFGVHQTQISAIKRRQTWTDV